jgi:hypothetical protein
VATVQERLVALEEAVASIATAVSTRRLVVADGDGRERLVAEVRGSTVELRLVSHGPGTADAVASVLLHASDGGGELGPAAGVQLWAHGEAIVEIDAWPDDTGRWEPHVRLGQAGTS